MLRVLPWNSKIRANEKRARIHQPEGGGSFSNVYLVPYSVTVLMNVHSENVNYLNGVKNLYQK